MTQPIDMKNKAPNVSGQIAPLVLAVDDDRTTLMMVEQYLLSEGYRVITAKNGKNACEIMTKDHKHIDAVVLNRMMPGMNGLEVVKWYKSQHHLYEFPIIMQTGADSPEEIEEGIDAGVFYYLTKPVDPVVLKSVVAAATKESRQNKLLQNEISLHKRGFSLMNKAKFDFKSITDAEALARFIAQCFPSPVTVLSGISALMFNAVEYGIFGITDKEKTEMVANKKWHDIMDKKAEEDSSGKHATLIYTMENNIHSIRITDPGKGFNWKKFMQVDPSKALENHGRGIARANMVFDKLQFNRAGNEAFAAIDNSIDKDKFEW